MVVDLTDVLQRGGEAGDRGDRHVLQQVLRIAVEVFDATAQAVVEQTEFEGEVVGIAGFPGQVGVGRIDQGAARGAHILVAVAGQGTPAVVAARQRTVDAIGSTETQVVDDILSLHEFFLADTPGTGHGPEVTPAGIRTQTGGTVTTEGSRSIVLAAVVVFQAGEDRHHRVAPVVAAGVEGTGRGNSVEGADREVLTGGTVEIGLVLLSLEADEGRKRMVAEALVEVQRGGGDDLLVDGGHLVHAAVVSRTRIVLGAVIDVVAVAGVVIGEDRAEIQPVGELDGRRLVDGEFQALGAVFPQIIVVQQVVAIALVAGGPGRPVFVIVRPVEGPQQVDRLHEVVVGVVDGIVEARAVGARHRHIRGQFEMLAHFLVEVHASADTVEAVDVNASLVFRI